LNEVLLFEKDRFSLCRKLTVDKSFEAHSVNKNKKRSTEG
jgi:hypothetical protein